MRSQAAGRIVRIRKLQKSYAQTVLREDELESTEYASLISNNEKVATGVEQNEEEEFHLQQALAATSGGTADQEIPAPPAQESADVDYDSLYPLVFKQPASYIRFSQTVEESTSCQYDMTTDDDIFLKAFNQKKSGPKCSENDFEKVMEAFEDIAADEVPYASIDDTLIPFEAMQQPLKQRIHPKVQVFVQDIYDHWKFRRQESGNTPLQPSLKFEKNQELDDGDPYVCFRRRDVRQTRKTRNRDVQSTEKLKRLRKEVEEGRQLISMAYNRELTKRELLKLDKEIFEQRAKLKEVKVKMSIKTDDEDLINQRPQKRKLSEYPQLQRQSGPQMRLPGRSDGRPLDADLIFLSELLAQKENLMRLEIEEKAEAHRKWNTHYVDLTRAPLSLVDGQESSFRPATAQYQYLMTPPSSVTSDSFDHPSPVQEKLELFTSRYSSPPLDDEPRGQPAYRRRIGRCGRLWIDRRGMSAIAKGSGDSTSDRWKYDQDDDDEQPVYELDPHDLNALRFRATIPLPPHPYPQRIQPPQNARATGGSPANNRAIAASQQAQAPT